MELLLALAVITAVILFGALITLGNESQRRAIDDLREQVVLWAIQDIRIKREHLARDVRVDDPLEWINCLVSKAWGHEMNLKFVEAYDQPQALVCISHDGIRVIFSPFSPAEIRSWKRTQKSKLRQYISGKPLSDLPSSVHTYEFSVLNGGMLFDMELPIVWKGLTGQPGNHLERLWMYIIP